MKSDGTWADEREQRGCVRAAAGASWVRTAGYRGWRAPCMPDAAQHTHVPAVVSGTGQFWDPGSGWQFQQGKQRQKQKQQWPRLQKGGAIPVLSMLCYIVTNITSVSSNFMSKKILVRENLNSFTFVTPLLFLFFWTGEPYFHFALGLTNYVASPEDRTWEKAEYFKSKKCRPSNKGYRR